MPRRVRATTTVLVFQWPCGTPTLRRSPRGARPWVRAMLVFAQVSPMKTRREDSRSGCASNQASRRFRISGRSCSLACAVFFARDPAAREEALQRPVAEGMAVARQGRPQLLHGDVRRLLKQAEHQTGLGLDPA